MNLYKGKSWEVIFIDWSQNYLGNWIISSSKESLSDLTDADWVELGKIEKELERVSKKVFNATMFNFACLMNDAYKNNEQPHVNFHFIPRYKDDVKMFNKIYRDKHFGYNLWKCSLSKFSRQRDIFNKEEKQKICEMIKEEFKIDCQ